MKTLIHLTSGTERLVRSHHDLQTSAAKRYQNGGLIPAAKYFLSPSAISNIHHRLS